METSILLVDDNEDILEFISGELIEQYRTVFASDGKEALRKMEEDTVHLVISDVMMPNMDGFQLCQAIKNNVQTSHIPVILLTAKNTLQSRIEGLEQGADAYIEKPFSLQYLKVQIANLLQNRNKIIEHFAQSPLIHIKSIAYSKADELFLESLNHAIVSNLENMDLDVIFLAKCMNMSRPTLYRKIREISNLTPNELINLTRLKRSAELIAEGSFKIYEIADMVGYSSQSIFGRNFVKQFGMTPTEYSAMVHSAEANR